MFPLFFFSLFNPATLRYSVRDKRVERAIGDRMRAFRQFVSLFEDDV